MGFTGDWLLLLIGSVNEFYAHLILRKCAAKHWRYPLRQIGTCYNQGLNATARKGDDGFAYGVEIAHRYLRATVKHERLALAANSRAGG